MAKCGDCKQAKPVRMSAFQPYQDVCHDCEKARAERCGVRAMDPDAWPVEGFGDQAGP